MRGLASYHFNAEGTGAHISYSSPLCVNWPALDDGSRPPAEKPFTEVSFDPAGCWFEGTIDWSPTSWQGDARWRCAPHPVLTPRNRASKSPAERSACGPIRVRIHFTPCCSIGMCPE